jgi:hypothetical protein
MDMGDQPAGGHGHQVDLVGPSGQSIHVEGIKPAGFMDDRNYPLSPGSERAYKEISGQFDQWIDVLGTRDGPQAMDAEPGPGSNASRYKKNLSVMVPDMPTGPIMREQMLPRGDDGGPGSSTAAGSHHARGGHGGTLSSMVAGMGSLGDLMGMPSPGGLLFSADSLFTSRGGLNLDLPTPDSETNLPLNQAGSFEWPSSSRDSMLPGFSDAESGEELPGGLMVTGRGLKPAGPAALQRAGEAGGGGASASPPPRVGGDGGGGAGGGDAADDGRTGECVRVWLGAG